MKKYSYDEVVKIIEDEGCKLITKEYKDNRTKMEILCSCGKNIFHSNLKNFIRNRKICDECYTKETGIHLWNIETMTEYCNKFNYKLLEIKWIDKSYQKQLWALVKCPNQNHEEHWVWWNNFVKGNRCKKCDYEINNKILWNKDVAYEFFMENNLKMLNINDFKNVDTPIACYNSYGFVVYPSISNLKQILNGYQRKLSYFKGNKHAIYNVKHYCELYRPEYEILSNEYIGVKEKYKFKYNGDFLRNEDYDREFECTLDCFIHGDVGHPQLSKSKGEIKVEQFLIDNNINYVAQKTFKDCRDKQRLPFDFYVINYNLIIEVMGKQHEVAVDYFGGEEQFLYIKRHDELKRKYAEDNGIDLLYIWYYELDNIPEILKNKLKLTSVA